MNRSQKASGKRGRSRAEFAILRYFYHTPKPWRHPPPVDPERSKQRLTLVIRELKSRTGADALLSAASSHKKRPLMKRNPRRPFLLRNLERGWNGWTKTNEKAHEYALSRTQSTSAVHETRSPTPEPEVPEDQRPIVTFPASDNGEAGMEDDDADSDVENRSNPLPNEQPPFARTPAVEGLKRWRDVSLNLSPIGGPSTSAAPPNGRHNPRVFQSTPNPNALKRPLKRSSQPLLSPERPKRPAGNDRRFR